MGRAAGIDNAAVRPVTCPIRSRMLAARLAKPPASRS